MENIYQRIEQEITNTLIPLKEVYKQQGFDFEIQVDCYNDDKVLIEVRGYHNDEFKTGMKTEFILLRMNVCNDFKQIHIPNIFLPAFMKHNGIGKKLIHKVFVFSNEMNYKLFIVDMVDSFYQRMIKRGALPCKDCYDAVEIVSETRLI